MVTEGSVVAVEREMARYYDAEEAREDWPLDAGRIAARERFIDRLVADAVRGPVLEIGSGPGRDALALAEAGRDVIGFDLSHGHARRAASRGVTMAVGSVRTLPFASASIGALWSMSTLMHVPTVTIESTMEEIARVLAPAAIVAIGVWGGPDSEELVSNPEEQADGPRRLFSRRSEGAWRDLLQLVGEIETFEVWDFVPGTDFRYHLAFLQAYG
jgi:SAM-dependent methyltransferase